MPRTPKSMPSEVLRDQIVPVLKEAEWTQADLAEAIGTSQPTVSAILRGDRNPGWDIVCRMADALEIEITTG